MARRDAEQPIGPGSMGRLDGRCCTKPPIRLAGPGRCVWTSRGRRAGSVNRLGRSQPAITVWR